jgi:hypothetical protein
MFSGRRSVLGQQLIDEAVHLARTDLEQGTVEHGLKVVNLLRGAVEVLTAEFGPDAPELTFPLLLKARALGNVVGPSAHDEAIRAYHRGITLVEAAGLEWDQELLIHELRGVARRLAECPSDLPEADEMLARLAALLRES